MKTETTKVKVERTKYIEKCTYCNKDIVGTSETQTLYNLSVHIRQKHGENK